MNRIDRKFGQLNDKKQKALINFVVGGDPNIDLSLQIIKKIAENGADIIEIGIPFADPSGDGPVIEEASKRALAAGASLRKILRMVGEFRKYFDTPIVLMGYFNSILAYGLKTFADDCQKYGVDGALIVDLPLEEEAQLLKILQDANINLIKLVALTTGAQRVEQITKTASGFIYLVSILGITGTKSANLEEVKDHVKIIKKTSDVPCVVGFGVKNGTDAAQILQSDANGVVVGSALVSIIANENDPNLVLEKIAKKVEEFHLQIKN